MLHPGHKKVGNSLAEKLTHRVRAMQGLEISVIKNYIGRGLVVVKKKFKGTNSIVHCLFPVFIKQHIALRS